MTLSTKVLESKLRAINQCINNNDGRLTIHSSCDLDYNLDKQEAIEKILVDRKVSIKKLVQDLEREK